MSLCCGGCTETIYEGFGLIYLLKRDKDGALIFPDKSKDIVPPNCAVCAKCFSKIPSEVLRPAMVGEEIQRLPDPVYVYAAADSGRMALFGGAKEWSSIQAEDEFRPIEAKWLEEHYGFLVGIIRQMAEGQEAAPEVRIRILPVQGSA